MRADWELKARKMRKSTVIYCFDSSVGILSYAAWSKITSCQDTWTDSWVENDGFLMYGKTPCKKVKYSSQKVKYSSTSVRPLKLCVYNSTEESHYGFSGRCVPPRNWNSAVIGKFSPSGGSGKEEKEKEKMKEKRKKRKKKEDFLKEVVASNVSYFECLFDDRWRVLKGIGWLWHVSRIIRKSKLV